MKIAIAGYGQEGEASYRYWSSDSQNEITIVDENQPKLVLPIGVKTIIGGGVFNNLKDFDLVVRTAGLPPRKIKTSGKIWSATNEFFDKCSATIIGVTGSKGKGTTASLIASILREAGRTVWLVGNIGKPALDVLARINPDDVVVYELSSFQLWDLEFSPHIAVVLHIEQEHLDVHTDMDEYVDAKAHITKYQKSGDIVIYNSSNKYSYIIASQSKGVKIQYPDKQTAHVENNNFYYKEQKICSTSSLKLIGKHNLDNACAAINAIWNFDVSNNAIKKGLEKFAGLPHRLQFVREVNGVKYYDDSIATTPSSAIAALKSFNNVPKVIILGGSSMGSDFTELSKEMPKHDVYAILIGDEAKRIEEAFESSGFMNYEILQNPTAKIIVNRACSLSKPGGVVLLSPASASFGLFKNYVDRGEQFISAVMEIKS